MPSPLDSLGLASVYAVVLVVTVVAYYWGDTARDRLRNGLALCLVWFTYAALEVVREDALPVAEPARGLLVALSALSLLGGAYLFYRRWTRGHESDGRSGADPSP